MIDLFICSLFVCPTEKAAVASATKGAAGTTQVRFKLEYHTAYGQHVAITGNQPELGSWNAKSALKYARSRGSLQCNTCYAPSALTALSLSDRRLHYLREGEWEGVANFAPNTQLEYKFLLINDQGVALRWEDGPNRGFTVPDVDVELGEVWRVLHS